MMGFGPVRESQIWSLAYVLAGVALLASNSAAASDAAWTRYGPEGGEVNTLAVHPDDASIVFAGTVDGVYRSDNGGQTWSRKSEGIGSRTTKSIVINPQRTDEMFVLVWGDGGLFKSVDGGETWLPLAFGEERGFRILRYSPTPFTLYLVNEYDLFISADSGETWVEEYIDTGFDPTHDLAVHPIHPQYMAVATSSGSGGIEMSEDGGRTWRTCGRPPSGVYNVAFDPADPNIVYVPERDVFYRSNDGCRTWDSIGQPGMSPFGFLVADPSRPSTLYHGNSNGVIVSSNGGNDWRRYGPNDDPLSCADIAVSASNPDALYLAAQAMDERRGVFQSDNGGLTWKIGMTALFATRIESIGSNPANPAIAYAGASNSYGGKGVFKTSDSGSTWKFLEGTEEAGPIVAVDPISPEIVYATTADWGVLKSTNAGQNWLEVWRGWGDRRIGGIEVDHHRAGTLFAQIDEHYHDAYRSDDGGETWVELELPLDAGFYGLFSDPHSPGVVHAATWGGLYRSSDWGDSWVSVSAGLEAPDPAPWYDRPWQNYYVVEDLVFDPVDPQLMYAATVVGPFRTTNGGLTWELVRNGMYVCCGYQCGTSDYFTCEGGPLGLAVDPDHRSTVYASTSFGTYRSLNRGERWKLVTGPEQAYVKSIEALGDGLLLGASDSAGVLRLRVPPPPPPRRSGHRVLPQGLSTSKIGIGQHHD